MKRLGTLLARLSDSLVHGYVLVFAIGGVTIIGMMFACALLAVPSLALGWSMVEFQFWLQLSAVVWLPTTLGWFWPQLRKLSDEPDPRDSPNPSRG